MSTTCKLSSEDTVTSNYKVPVIDLCSDEESHIHLQPVKASKRGKTMENLPPSTLKQNSRKKMKMTHTQAVVEPTKNNNNCPCAGIEGGKKKRGFIDGYAASFILLNTSDESSG